MAYIDELLRQVSINRNAPQEGGLQVNNPEIEGVLNSFMPAPSISQSSPELITKPVIIPVDSKAKKDPKIEALNKGFLSDTYKPSEMSKLAGASDNTIRAERQANGNIMFTNIGTKTWSEIEGEKAKETTAGVMGTSPITPQSEFVVGNIKKIKESLVGEKDPTVIASSISSMKESATTFLQKMELAELNKQETLLGIPLMQSELQQARLLDQQVAATDPSKAINARNVLLKIEQVRGQAAKSAESALTRNMTYIGVKTELEGFDKDPIVQGITATMAEGIKSKFEGEELAASFQPIEKSNAITVWNDAVDKDGKPDYKAIGARYKHLPANEKAVLRFTPYEAAQIAIADPSNSTASMLFRNSLIKDGFPEEEAIKRVQVAQEMVKDVNKFKIAYDAIVPKKERPAGDSLLLPDNTKKETVIQEDNLQKARIVREYMRLEATREFTRKADTWLSLFTQDDPALAKAIDDVRLAGKEASISNIASLYMQGTAEEQRNKATLLKGYLTKTMQSKKPTVLGALDLQRAINELPGIVGPAPWYTTGAKWFNEKDMANIFNKGETSPLENYLNAFNK